MANVQYPAERGALAQAALPAAQGIQPADELAENYGVSVHRGKEQWGESSP